LSAIFFKASLISVSNTSSLVGSGAGAGSSSFFFDVATQKTIEKIGEVRLDTHTYHVAQSPITVRGGVNVGYWKEDSVKGSHKEYYAEVSHDPIKLGKNADLRFLGGYIPI